MIVRTQDGEFVNLAHANRLFIQSGGPLDRLWRVCAEYPVYHPETGGMCWDVLSNHATREEAQAALEDLGQTWAAGGAK